MAPLEAMAQVRGGGTETERGECRTESGSYYTGIDMTQTFTEGRAQRREEARSNKGGINLAAKMTKPAGGGPRLKTANGKGGNWESFVFPPPVIRRKPRVAHAYRYTRCTQYRIHYYLLMYRADWSSS